MFTGIIEGQGWLKKIESLQAGFRFHIETSTESILNVGDSISVSGACLTVVAHVQNEFCVDLSRETIEKTFFCESQVGDLFNLERALTFNSRIQGHWVTGHIDGTGIVKELNPGGEFLEMSVKLPAQLSNKLIEKGSIAIDGVSLTVNNIKDEVVHVMLVPETLKKTTLRQKKVGDKVQVELDLIGKYVYQWMQAYGKY